MLVNVVVVCSDSQCIYTEGALSRANCCPERFSVFAIFQNKCRDLYCVNK